VRASTREEPPVPFPVNYRQVVLQCQQSVQAALADGMKLVEVEFPTLGLANCPGDSEGVNEMNESAALLRQLCAVFERAGTAEGVRVFFPDEKERDVALEDMAGRTMFGNKWETEPTFRDSPFQLDFLTQPTPLLELGIDTGANVCTRVQRTDELFIAAYPSFNVNEMLAVEQLHANAADGRPIVVFNGELDRIRSGYYPAFFYPKIGKLAKNFLPGFDQAYYIHNFKGAKGGVLFRAYPGPWQVLTRRNIDGDEQLTVVHTQETMPTLKEVALDILPRAAAR